MSRKRLVQGLVWLGLTLLPLFIGEWQTLQLAQFLTYGLFAMSLALAWGRLGLLSFGHALFFGLGAYAMALATMGRLPGLEAFPSSWLGLALACLVPWATAQLLGFFLFHGRGLRGAYFGITMLALAVLAERLTQGTAWLGGLNGLIGVPPLALGLDGGGPALLDPLPTYWVMLGVAFAVFLGLEMLLASSRGLAMTAVRENEDRLGFLGYDVAAIKRHGFALSAAIAGLAGALFASQFGFVSPKLIGFGLSAEVLIWTALGGREMLLAAFFGALLLSWTETVLAGLLGAYWLLALAALLVLSVLFFERGFVAGILTLLSRGRRPGRR
ncbi:MAG: branched-chain amino acid ABC transporter permease [Geminicoccaceae bacterium]|jgi:ABC-type branched-subunit amino acid transport system permease subunit|nr:branched-chain amino acid ABC transporter permease [Geminicoccaceae bacterium]HRY26813.1 branched-chain amino acid ABC transporter permease [Geminicoccaceae bacterium]